MQRRAARQSLATRSSPLNEAIDGRRTKGRGGKMMRLGHLVGDRTESLNISRGFQPLHNPLASPCWQARDCSIPCAADVQMSCALARAPRRGSRACRRSSRAARRSSIILGLSGTPPNRQAACTIPPTGKRWLRYKELGALIVDANTSKSCPIRQCDDSKRTRRRRAFIASAALAPPPEETASVCPP
jgi:hypothetical protein